MTRLTDQKPEFIPAYEGDDMASYILERGLRLPERVEIIKAITNVRNMAIIVTDDRIYRARPEHGCGFCVEVLAYV